MIPAGLRKPSFLIAAAVFCACIAAWFFLRNSPFAGNEKKDAQQLAAANDWAGLARYTAEKTVQDADNAELWFYRGYALYNLGRVPEAQAAYERVIQINPAFPDAHVSLGVIAASHRNYRLAVDRYLAALKYRPGYPLAQQNLAIAYYFDGQHGKAWDTWQELAKSDPARAKAIQERFLLTDVRPTLEQRRAPAMASTPATRRPPCPECTANR